MSNKNTSSAQTEKNQHTTHMNINIKMSRETKKEQQQTSIELTNKQQKIAHFYEDLYMKMVCAVAVVYTSQ